MMGVDYAMYGKSDATLGQFVDDFTMGILVSTIMLGGSKTVEAFCRTDQYGHLKHITQFDRLAQSDLSALNGQMAQYMIRYCCGDEELMRSNGMSEAEIRKAKAAWEKVLAEYNSVYDSLKGAEAYEIAQGGGGEVAGQAAQTLALSSEGRLGDTDIRFFSTETALEDADEVTQAWTEAFRSAVQGKSASAMMSYAANAIKLAQAAQTNLDIAHYDGQITEQAYARVSNELQWVSKTATETLQGCLNQAMPGYRYGSFNRTQDNGAKTITKGRRDAPYEATAGAQGVRDNGGRQSALDSGEQAARLGESKSQRAADTEGTGSLTEAERASLREQELNRQTERFGEVKAYKNASEFFGSEKYEGDVAEIPEELYTEGMKETAEKLAKDGIRVRYFKGTLMTETADGRLRRIPGLFVAGTNEVWASVSSARFSPEQLALHEYYHALVNMGKANVEQTVQEIREKFSPEEFERLVEQYIKDYRGAYQGDRIEDIYEELLCDAYAGMNRFAKEQSAVQYQDTVRDQTQRGTNENERATRDTRGAPEQKFSFGRGIKLGKQEFRKLQSARMTKYTTYGKMMLDVDWIFANDMFYIIKNYELDSFNIVKRLDPAKDNDIIEEIMEAIDNGSQNENEVYSEIIEVLQSEQRDSVRGRSNNADRRSGRQNAGLVHGTEDGTDGGRNKEGSDSNSDRDGGNGGIKKFSFDDEDDTLAVEAEDMDAAAETSQNTVALSDHGTQNDRSYASRFDEEKPTVHSLLMETDASKVKNATERKYLKEYQETANRQLAEQQKLDKLQAELDALPKEKRQTSRARFLRDEIIKTKNRLQICQSIQTRLETDSPLTYLINREINPRLAQIKETVWTNAGKQREGELPYRLTSDQDAFDDHGTPLISSTENRERRYLDNLLRGKVRLRKSQKDILKKIPKRGDWAYFPKSDIQLKDLAALTCATKDEFALFSGSENTMVIHGGVKWNLPDEAWKEIKQKRLIWVGHSHPTTVNISASIEDRRTLRKYFTWQERSAIIDMTGAIYEYSGSFADEIDELLGVK